MKKCYSMGLKDVLFDKDRNALYYIQNLKVFMSYCCKQKEMPPLTFQKRGQREQHSILSIVSLSIDTAKIRCYDVRLQIVAAFRYEAKGFRYEMVRAISLLWYFLSFLSPYRVVPMGIKCRLSS